MNVMDEAISHHQQIHYQQLIQSPDVQLHDYIEWDIPNQIIREACQQVRTTPQSLKLTLISTSNDAPLMSCSTATDAW
jgi:hypothetical protein